VDLAIESLTPATILEQQPALIALLQDAVASGASVGFLPPLAADEAAAYWQGVAAALRDGSRVLLVARRPGQEISGTVQLDLAMRANGLHRAEVSKLMVHRAARRQGIARALMLELEAIARRLGRTTLILDTRQGDPSELLYRALGYEYAGAIPQYARSADGSLDGTAFYYRLLGS
jgi:ribosomal protein S18 acetylase RimI-like enzyme